MSDCESNFSSGLCNVFSIHEILKQNSIDIPAYKLLLISIPSFFSCVSVTVKKIQFLGITLTGYDCEKSCLERIGVEYLPVSNEEFYKLIKDGTPVLAYMYRQYNHNLKKYYIDVIHTAVLFRGCDGTINVKDPNGITKISEDNISLLEHSRFVKLYPKSPNGIAFMLKEGQPAPADKTINATVDAQLEVIAKSYLYPETYCDCNDIVFYYGQSGHRFIREKLKEIGATANNPISNRVFVLQMYMLLKCFINSKQFFMDEISYALETYGDAVASDTLKNAGKKLIKCCAFYEKIYTALQDVKSHINSKEKYTEMLIKNFEEICSINYDASAMIYKYLMKKKG